jgi:FkbM family methyltransferase
VARHEGWKHRRFDLAEVGLLLAFTALAVWTVDMARYSRAIQKASAEFEQTRAPDSAPRTELEPLAKKYGPSRNSFNEEEWIIRDFFGDRHGGVFVDVGANHYKRFSNTFYLESVLGWSGVAVEPQREFEAGYTEHRPRTKFEPFFVSDKSNAAAKLYVQPDNSLVTSGNKAFNAQFGKNTKEIEAPTITLTDLLEHLKVTSFDFLNLDIELWEPKALAGFDIDRFKPALVCVEAHLEVRQQILDYFGEHNYSVVGKYLRADTENLYFMPRP